MAGPAEPLASAPSPSPSISERASAWADAQQPQPAEANLISLFWFFPGPWPHSLCSDLFCSPGAMGTSKQLNEMQLLERPQQNLFV